MVPSFAAPPAGSLTVARRPLMRQQAQFPLLSVVVPTYNEAGNIGPFLEALRAGLDSVPAGGYEVIVVDDESPDGTGEIAIAISTGWPHLRVVRRAGERGLARAVVWGWQVACGDVLATINADFQHPPSILPEMLRKIETADLVVATRYAAEGSVGRFPLHRQFYRRPRGTWARCFCLTYLAESPIHLADAICSGGKRSKISSYGPPVSRH
jgi:dolichol-phosphate mannosyltransferase